MIITCVKCFKMKTSNIERLMMTNYLISELCLVTMFDEFLTEINSLPTF